MTIVGRSLKIPYESRERRTHKAINGKILRLDLSSGKIWVEEPGEQFYRTYIGGRGMVLYYLLNEMPRGIDPLEPDNMLVFAPGVLTGTLLPGTGRHGVGAKSPLTGALASGEAGGWWGVELKRAGFDGIVIQGKAKHPVYISIIDGEVRIRDARHLWGKPTADAQEEIRLELGDEKVRVAQVGLAGENLVRYACVTHDANRAAGRSGLGAVMGSKNLKAIAVRGASLPGFAEKESLSIPVKWIVDNYKDILGWAVATGTAGSVKSNHDVGSIPINNYRDGILPEVEKLDASTFFPMMLKQRDNCSNCPVYCKNVIEYQDNHITIDSRYGGPEYETLGALGPLCAITDTVSVMKASELCEVYGLDTISVGGTIAFTMECVEKGLLDDRNYDFLPRFGNGASLIESVHRIARRHGIGDLMAEGSARMARRLGPAADEFLVTSRGQELPMHDPRLKNACGMGYALSATGADHQHNMIDNFANNPNSDVCARLEELGIPTPLPLFGLDDVKIRSFIYETAFKNFLDSAVICHFYPYKYQHMIDALRGAAGWDIKREEIIAIGTRIITMGRLFLIREGFTAEDDKLPPRALQALATGPIAGKALTPQLLDASLKKYYQLMGWNKEGIPDPSTLADLGLSGIAQ